MARILPASGLALLACLTAPPACRAQGDDPYRLVVVTAPSPFGGYVYRDPVADRTVAAGEYLRSEGAYYIKIQKAKQEREKARQMRLETRRKELEQWKWERDFRLRVWEEDRERARAERLRHSQEDADKTEVLAGTVLNTLLDHLATKHLSQGNSEPIDRELLRHIEFTVVGGQASLLKAKKLNWPLLLQEEEFAADCQEIERLLGEARKQALKKEARLATLKRLSERVDALESGLDELLKKHGKTSLWVWRQYNPARRRVDELKANVQLLQQPETAEYLLTHKLEANNVAQLVLYMRSNGLRFAPAPSGGAGDRAYVALHRTLARESRRIQAEEGLEKKP